MSRLNRQSQQHLVSLLPLAPAFCLPVAALARRPVPLFGLAALVLALGLVPEPAGATLVRIPIEDGVVARIEDGYRLGLELFPRISDAGQRYLRNPNDWEMYRRRDGVGVNFSNLSNEAQRKVLLALFPNDYVNEEGWRHQVTYAGARGQETLWSLSEWLTGTGFNADRVAVANGLDESPLEVGQWILFPAELLLEVMQAPTPDRHPPPLEPASEADEPIPTQAVAEEENGAPVRPVSEEILAARAELSYVRDAQGEFAVYLLKPGEALYSAVVVRFTDIRQHSDILEACQVIAQRSGIRNVNAMRPGQRVLIPAEMLADPYKPEGTEERRQFDEVVAEAQRLRGQVRTRNLEGVVIVLDPGHGGKDPGAMNNRFGLIEDELNYDIACRIKRLLEATTAARVYMTVKDTRQGFTPTDASRFTHDTSEVLLTTPQYPNTDPAASVSLRAALANYIYARELERGTDPRKMVFTSIHCDAIYNVNVRGAMIYIPGAQHRRDSAPWMRQRYSDYKEVRESEYRSTAADRRRDEALSRNFAEAVLESLGQHRIKRHDMGAPIRSVIRQSGGREYLPGVINYNMIPTKVLIETANMTNPTDCQRLREAWWRERFAQAYVDALEAYFGE